ncbi:flagellar hook protein FlgE/flagellar basal-body rod protein FlgF/flagellar basal-body rod protein FlgG [Neorhodopirellula lusitana]|uniref:Flagellar hook protein FlgE/flagellar basal-body rod protein FlgF/flagellar basal-body rod protein FlgG n=1 Tax=Neorhodopirellula lusitana TaxID=445327 RepID=A0ABY1QAT0_9BACT|nr:flagellar hook basal-body protein [Neorhodopirellula lusitana]SMP63507.1 flagellar hook protein FlgE/flagellar basal-body rod protein FlgF/flagellar basal-body rod protein FlgG [Neorhodopirellula lusitana]
MPYGVYLSASGAQAQSHRLQQVSNNLANVETPGFKPNATILQARFSELIEQGEVSPGLGGIDDLGGGVTIQPEQTQFKVGAFRNTGNETDFAIHDKNSFFVLQRGDQQLLTRAGDFVFDSSGRMINQGGDQVLGNDGNPIQIDPRKPYQVGAEGRITQAGVTQELMLGRPQNLGDLSNVGGNLFKPLADFDLAPAGDRNVIAGSLEQSAVSPTGTMMELIETTRAYEANVQMIKNQDSVLGSLIGRVLKG